MSAIGFVGLGIMGEGMAARLLSQGVAGSPETPLVVWNRTGQKCTDLKEKFPDKSIEIKATAREVIESCGVTYSMLSTPEASKAVFFQEETGVLAGISEGKSIVDCATLAEANMQEMDTAIQEKGGYVQVTIFFLPTQGSFIDDRTVENDISQSIFCVFAFNRRFLEAPVSGSKGPAHAGALIFLCAGNEDLFNEIKDSGLAAMGKASHFFRTQVGYGTRAKLVVNSLMGTMMAAFGEGLALSESLGLDATKMIEVIGQGAIQSPMYAMKGPKMIVKDHDPNFPLKHAHKDMDLACAMAKAAGVEYSVMEQAEKIFRDAREDADLNVADEDFSAVYEKIKKESA